MITVYPRRTGGRWYFEGPEIDSLPSYFNELGMNDIIERVASKVANSEAGFKLAFSDTEFPEHKFTLDRKEAESGGYWYFSEDLKLMGWMGPELKNYLPDFPLRIYANYEPIES